MSRLFSSSPSRYTHRFLKFLSLFRCRLSAGVAQGRAPQPPIVLNSTFWVNEIKPAGQLQHRRTYELDVWLPVPYAQLAPGTSPFSCKLNYALKRRLGDCSSFPAVRSKVVLWDCRQSTTLREKGGGLSFPLHKHNLLTSWLRHDQMSQSVGFYKTCQQMNNRHPQVVWGTVCEPLVWQWTRGVPITMYVTQTKGCDLVWKVLIDAILYIMVSVSTYSQLCSIMNKILNYVQYSSKINKILFLCILRNTTPL